MPLLSGSPPWHDRSLRLEVALIPRDSHIPELRNMPYIKIGTLIRFKVYPSWFRIP